MKQFEVRMECTVAATVWVKAETKEQAMKLANEGYGDWEPDDDYDREFEAVSAEEVPE